MNQTDSKRRKDSLISYRVLLTLCAFGVFAILIIGAFVTRTPVKGSMDGLTKLSFEIFERTRDRAIIERDKPKPSSINGGLPKDLADRIQRSRAQLAGSSILWVDDGGARQNVWERRALSSLGIAVDTATTTEEALDLLKTGFPYDVIITDLARDNGDPAAACYPGSTLYKNAGCAFIQQAQELCGDDRAPIIIYAAGINASAGQPPFSAGMTNRFDKLINFVLDAAERRPRTINMPAGASVCARTPLSKGQKDVMTQ
jgi:CheY-like chemotaxis protein